MTTTYKAQQIKFALVRLQEAVDCGLSVEHLKWLSCDAAKAGATAQQIEKIWKETVN